MEVFSEYFEQIPTNFNDLKKKLQEKHLVVNVNESLGLFLVKYNKDTCDMSDPLVRKCRGIVARTTDLKAVCVPPFKSEKLENFTKDIFWNEIAIEEFVDGTMINMFYHNEEWLISTRSRIGANCRWIGKKNFNTLFSESNDKIDYDLLDKSFYYTFVLTHPENRIVKEYTEPSLVLVQVGRLNNDKHEVLDLEDQNIGIPIPKIYRESNLNEAIINTNNKDFDFQGLVLKNGNRRSKIRNAKYNYARSLKSNTNNLCYLYFYLSKNMFTQDYLTFFPEHKEFFDSYEERLNTLVKLVHTNYVSYHIKKSIKINDMPYRVRPLCYEVHGQFMKTQQKTTEISIKNYIMTLPIPRILFSIKQDN